jgi:excisionase family DNA binding protein
VTADIQVDRDLSSLVHYDDILKTSDLDTGIAARATVTNIEDYQLLTVEETADILHVGRDKVYYLIRTGQLRSIKIGNLRRISRGWIREFIARIDI